MRRGMIYQALDDRTAVAFAMLDIPAGSMPQLYTSPWLGLKI